MFGAHLASAVSLLFLLFEGRGEGGADVDVGFWVAPQASEIKAFRRGPPRTALAWLPLPPSISPLFDATTIAHNARGGDAFETVISPFGNQNGAIWRWRERAESVGRGRG